MVKVDSIIINKMHNRAKVYISTYILMFYWVNTELNKLDHFSQIVGPSVLTWLIHVNSHEYEYSNEYNFYGIPSRQKPCEEVLPSPIKLIYE